MIAALLRTFATLADKAATGLWLLRDTLDARADRLGPPRHAEGDDREAPR